MDLKKQHEKFIINEEGTSVLRYAVFCLQLSLSIFISKLCINTFPAIRSNRLLSFLVEFICLHLFTIFSTTILDDLYLLLFVIQVLIIVSILTVRICQREYQKKPNKKRTIEASKRSIIQAIFLNVLINTTIMILAVDFKVFPRRNGKIEHYGLGLMDAGAICFLGINAVISPEARLLNTVDGLSSRSNKLKVFNKNVYSCCKLLIVGFIRLFTIKNLNYQEHASEYGVHMNFFLLLVLIKLLGMTIAVIFNRLVLHPLFGFSLICLHEILLKQFGLNNYIQQDTNRHSFLEKNKESFFTILGYVGFYLSCFNLPCLLESGESKAPFDKLKEERHLKTDEDEVRYKTIYRLFSHALFYFIIFNLSDSLSERISRRNMNMAFTCLTLSLVYLICGLETLWVIIYDRYYADHQPEKKNLKDDSGNHPFVDTVLTIQNSYTNNGLIAFLLSNILTGFVNMSTNTMQTSNLNAIVLLFAYSFVVAVSISYLDYLNTFY